MASSDAGLMRQRDDDMKPAVLITGGAKRIGAVLSRAFGAAGWHVAVHYGRSRHAAEALAASLPSAETVHCDLADPDAASAMVDSLDAKLANWRVLINNAGVFRFDDAARLDPAIFGEAMQVNAAAPVRMAQRFLAGSKRSAGRRVVHVTDQKLANPNPDFLSYTMSKHALAATIQMASMARGREDDRIYGLAPGAILASHDQDEHEIERSHRMNLLQRRTQAAEIADAAIFLAQGWLASGQTLFVDSGQHLLRQPRDVLFLARQ